MLVSDYIAKFLAGQGIRDVFSVVGGGSMFLNHAFGLEPDLEVTYFHHEQSCAIAAEAYARMGNKIAVVCVTSGPGATNAITGCLCGYMASIPMLIISGQVRSQYTTRSTKLQLRSIGEQEHDICKTVESMTKYADMVQNPNDIRYHLEKALHQATSGRPGPCWLDIPLDIQSSNIEVDNLKSYQREDLRLINHDEVKTAASVIHQLILDASRPVLHLGYGVRASGAVQEVLSLIDSLNIPVVTGINTVDLVPYSHPLKVGNTGVTGDRPGNFAIQNSDLIVSIGSRLGLKHTGYNREAWARKAYVVSCDIDENELSYRDDIVDMSLHCDAKDLIIELLNVRQKELRNKPAKHAAWLGICTGWREKYPVVHSQHSKFPDRSPSIYAFLDILSSLLDEGDVIVTTAGTSRVAAAQALRFKRGQRLIVNTSTAPMGYCLPAAIGASVYLGCKPITLIASDGGLQMNLQELQTIVHHRLPIRILVINNQGYHSIRQSQSAFFPDSPLMGIGEQTGDLSFPSLERISAAYGIPYSRCSRLNEVKSALETVFKDDGPTILEILVDINQKTEPKVTSRRLPDGSFVSLPLEDMSPRLSRDELAREMLIELHETSIG